MLLPTENNSSTLKLDKDASVERLPLKSHTK